MSYNPVYTRLLEKNFVQLCEADDAGDTEKVQNLLAAKTRKYQTLDGMRGVAALMVVVFHAHPLWGRQLLPSSYLAVDLFFVLSGFVIAHAYERRLGAGMTFPEFMAVRLIRFYPLYLAGLLLGIGTAIGSKIHGTDFFSFSGLAMMAAGAFFFVPVPGPSGALFFLNIPSWSLFFELIVNGLYALFFRYLDARCLWIVAALSFCVFVVFVLKSGSGSLGASISEFPAGLARTIFSFSVGVLIYRSGFQPRLPSGVPVVAVLLVMMASVPGILRPFFDLISIGLVFPIAVAAGGSSEPQGRATSVFSYLGGISYCLYAIHYPLVKAIAGSSKALHLPGTVLGVGLIVALLIACPVLDRWYDRPIREWLGRGRIVPEAAAP